MGKNCFQPFPMPNTNAMSNLIPVSFHANADTFVGFISRCQKENTFIVIKDIAELPFLGHLHANTNTILISKDLYFQICYHWAPTCHTATAFYSVLLATLACLLFLIQCRISLSSSKRKQKL